MAGVRTEWLPERARARIEAADTVAISAASAWEMALLADAGRVELDRPVDVWMHHAARQASLRTIATPLGRAEPVSPGRRPSLPRPG